MDLTLELDIGVITIELDCKELDWTELLTIAKLDELSLLEVTFALDTIEEAKPPPEPPPELPEPDPPPQADKKKTIIVEMIPGRTLKELFISFTCHCFS
jgi:hypothetical protein